MGVIDADMVEECLNKKGKFRRNIDIIIAHVCKLVLCSDVVAARY